MKKCTQLINNSQKEYRWVRANLPECGIGERRKEKGNGMAHSRTTVTVSNAKNTPKVNDFNMATTALVRTSFERGTNFEHTSKTKTSWRVSGKIQNKYNAKK